MILDEYLSYIFNLLGHFADMVYFWNRETDMCKIFFDFCQRSEIIIVWWYYHSLKDTDFCSFWLWWEVLLTSTSLFPCWFCMWPFSILSRTLFEFWWATSLSVWNSSWVRIFCTSYSWGWLSKGGWRSVNSSVWSQGRRAWSMKRQVMVIGWGTSVDIVGRRRSYFAPLAATWIVAFVSGTLWCDATPFRGRTS